MVTIWGKNMTKQAPEEANGHDLEQKHDQTGEESGKRAHFGGKCDQTGEESGKRAHFGGKM